MTGRQDPTPDAGDPARPARGIEQRNANVTILPPGEEVEARSCEQTAGRNYFFLRGSGPRGVAGGGVSPPEGGPREGGRVGGPRGAALACARAAGMRPIGFRGEICAGGPLRGRAAARWCPGEPRDVVFVAVFQLYDFRLCLAPYFLRGRMAARHVFCGGTSTLRFSFVPCDLFFVGENAKS